MDKNPKPDQAPEATIPSAPSKSSRKPFLLLLIIILVFVVLIGWLAAVKPDKKTASTSQNASTSGTVQKAQVDISSSGFEPATLSVAINTQVTWTNNDTVVHQVAADPYPKDDSIAGFNSNIVLQQGDKYSFVFTKAGTYTYHDELNPLKINGTIIVK